MNSAPPVLPRRQRSRAERLLLAAGFLFGSLLLLIVLVLLVENWRGKRAWLAFKAAQEAKGERFELASFIPPAVAPEENFAMTPFLAPLLDYRPGRPVTWLDPEGRERADEFAAILKGSRENPAPPAGNWEVGTFLDLQRWSAFLSGSLPTENKTETTNAAAEILTALAPFDSVMDELQAASRARRHSAFPVHYEENFHALLPHLSVLKASAQVVRLRALARLSAGRKEDAFQDALLALRLGEAVRSEPLLISQLVRIAIHHLALQPVWEGLARREWTERQLRDLQSALANIQVLPDYGRAMRGERAFSNDLFDKLRRGELSRAEFTSMDDARINPNASRFLPSGWFYHNQVVLNRLHEDYTLPTIDAEKRRAYPAKAALAEDIPELRHWGPYNRFAGLLLPAIGKSALKFAKCQTSIDLAMLACALERHHQARRNYPDKLEALIPEFISALPHDIITGESLHYARTDDGRFVLYSVGWNETDDGGGPKLRKAGEAAEPAQGDWVWRYAGN